MAIVSGQLKEAGIQGKPRDIMDEIFSVAPTDTPFLSMCGRSEASQALHEWQTDELVLPGENERLEGAETSEFTASTSTELNNRTQILMKAINVSGTAQAVRQAGVEVGMVDPYHFSKTFKNIVGMSPSAYSKTALK